MMLLCLSSRWWRVLEEPVEVAGEVALEAAGGLAAGFSVTSRSVVYRHENQPRGS
jgi:hypothetical protein